MATKKQTELKSKILSDLPALQGSPKQIEWATKIRQAWVGDMKAMFRDLESGFSKTWPDTYKLEKWAKQHDEASASEWIDNRRGAATGQRGY